MNSLPKGIRERLASEFALAATKVAGTDDISEKMYYFSVFYGEAGRQLNMHWDADLALLHSVLQATCQQINARTLQSTSDRPPLGGFPDGFFPAVDEVSNELAAAFGGEEVDLARLYAALARAAELQYVVGGNGIYLYEKGMIKL